MNKKFLSTVMVFLSSTIANSQVAKTNIEKLNSLLSSTEARETDNGTGTCIVDTEKTLNTLKKYEQIKLLLNNNTELENAILKRALLEELLNENSEKN